MSKKQKTVLGDVRSILKEHWWLTVFEGGALILLGLIALFFPGAGLSTLLLIFAVFAVLWGLIGIVRGIENYNRHSWWLLDLVFGFAVLGAGIFLASNPNAAVAFLAAMIGFVLVMRGIYDLCLTIFAFGDVKSQLWMAFAGLLTIAVGIAIWKYPTAGGIAFVWLLSLYALIAGTVLVATAVRVRSDVKKLM